MAEYEADKLDIDIKGKELIVSVTRGKTTYVVKKPAKQVKALIGKLKRQSKLAQKRGVF